MYIHVHVHVYSGTQYMTGNLIFRFVLPVFKTTCSVHVYHNDQQAVLVNLAIAI